MVLRAISSVVVEFCRAVPVLLLMIFFWRWFAFAGLSSPSYWAVVLALVLYNGSVVAELVRSGVGNLPGGQREASLALGLTETQSLMEIEVPQAVYAMLPAAVTQLVVVLKDTALGSIIMYTDLLQESRRLGSMYFNILQTLVMAAVIYFIVCWLLSRLAEWLPSRMQQRTAAPTEPEPVPPIAIMDPSNVNQIAVAKEVEERPLRGTPLTYHAHHRGSNASIHNWQRTRYEQGFDEAIPIRRVEMRAMPSRRTLKTTRNDPCRLRSAQEYADSVPQPDPITAGPALPDRGCAGPAVRYSAAEMLHKAAHGTYNRGHGQRRRKIGQDR